MDGLSYLCEEGFEVSIVDPWKFPANPLARRDPLYAGIDPLRSAIMLSSLKKWDVAVGIGDTSCLIILQLRKLLKFKNGIVVIDPSLSDEWPKQRFAQKLVLPLADRVVVYGSAQVDYLSREFSLSENIRFLHHRIDTRFFDPRKCSTSKGSYVLTVGNDLARDFPTLLEAARLSDAIFVVHSSLQLGDDLPPNLQVNRDWISHSDLRELYHAADLAALPVLDRVRAGGINTLLEAMAMGKPVIVSDSAGLRDYVQHGKTAWIVPVGDPRAMADAIHMLRNDSYLAAELGRNAREFCISTCSMPKYAQAVGEILWDVASRDLRATTSS
jgi:glycosyltransferase involved in cell wall biosynthesis